MTTVLEQEIGAVCDQAYEMMLDGAVIDGMYQLHGELYEIRNARQEGRLSAMEIIDHPVTRIIHQDPLTYHAFSKPRGYAGDAELLDYIYKIIEPDTLGREGGDVYRYNVDTGACRSVRERRRILADYIDRVASDKGHPNIISIACGHLREAMLSGALRDGEVGDFIAVDQDADSLASINAALPNPNVRAVQASVLQLLTGRVSFADADLVYSAGLYDYLELRVARKLTARMFDMLNPGGTLLVANFAPNLREIGYMETFMDWHLIYRNEAEIVAVADEIDQRSIAGLEVFRDLPGNLVFLEVRKS